MALSLAPNRVRAARVLGVAADAVQLGLLPLFVGGWVSPLNDALDLVVAIAMVGLVGWHWAFLPAFFSELIPIWDLVPSWTAAVLIATRNAPIEVAPIDVAPQAPPQGAARSLDAGTPPTLKD
jgi:hypothetical protein